MGCDIHLYVEKREGDRWMSADKWTPNKYYKNEGGNKLQVHYKDRFYSSRSYSLFAILANVRNGYGFAGLDTGDGFTPIDMPRGLPPDVTELVALESAILGCDGHSHSWLTVQELLDYDWTQMTKRRGWIDASSFYMWTCHDFAGEKAGEAPEEWCSGVVGAGVVHITRGEMERLVAQVTSSKKNHPERVKIIAQSLSAYYCPIEFVQPYHKCVREFWSDTMPRLFRLGRPSDVRIVFWFDN